MSEFCLSFQGTSNLNELLSKPTWLGLITWRTEDRRRLDRYWVPTSSSRRKWMLGKYHIDLNGCSCWIFSQAAIRCPPCSEADDHSGLLHVLCTMCLLMYLAGSLQSMTLIARWMLELSSSKTFVHWAGAKPMLVRRYSKKIEIYYVHCNLVVFLLCPVVCRWQVNQLCKLLLAWDVIPNVEKQDMTLILDKSFGNKWNWFNFNFKLQVVVLIRVI